MSRLSIATIERYAKDFRVNYIDTDLDSPINIKTVLTKLGVLALFRPLSEGLCGLSIRSTTDDRFMLINSNNNIGRQHFTVAHELYHLYYGTNTVPHICRLGGKEPEEVNADSFASALLMPEKGLIQQLPGEEYRRLIRLLKLHIINDATYQQFKSVTITSEAARYGYDTALYRPGNNGLYIGTLGEMAKKEFDRGKISEGHYLEILNMLPNERQEA